MEYICTSSSLLQLVKLQVQKLIPRLKLILLSDIILKKDELERLQILDREAYYETALVTGPSETFRHVMSATLNQSTNKWTTEWEDIAQAIDPKTSAHYNDNQYILTYALNYFYLYNYYDETYTIY